jgi:hypothetical protein
LHALEITLANCALRNIGNLYAFFMEFNVFAYAVNPVESLRKGRSVTQGVRAERLEPFRLFSLSTRLASFLPLRGPGVLLIPMKEKVPAALDALQRFPA